MASTKPRILLSLEYDRYAQEYLRGLPPEHFMEATGQSIQREITLESLALVRAKRPEVQVFSELLLQYPIGRETRPHQVVPDIMVMLHDKRLKAKGSYNLPLQPTGPLWVLEFVSKESKRKDYDESFHKHERELKVPYYLVFYSDEQELTLYRHNKRRYVSVKPNAHGRLALPELHLEMGIVEEWCRFWHRSKLLPLPGDLLVQVEQAEFLAEEARLHAEQAKLRADQEKLRADQEKLRADMLERELEQLRAKVKQNRTK